MFHHHPFRRIYPTVASRRAMFALANRHSQAPFDEDSISGMIHAGEWFEVAQPQYDEMLNLLPPLFVRPDTFAISAFNGGKVAIVFVALAIADRRRWFLGFCDLSVPNSPEMLRDAIIARETGPHPERLSRDERLEVIWNATPPEHRSYSAIPDPNNRSPRHRDRRMLLIGSGASASGFCLLETLTAAHIEERLPADLAYIAAIDGTGAGLGEAARLGPAGDQAHHPIADAPMLPATKIVITHPKMGIYLGNCLGLGFWTLLDPAGQPEAVVFDSVADARAHIASWESGNRPDDYGFHDVSATGRYATIPMLIEAGLSHLLGDMAADHLRSARPDGNA
jgi:hypothetical protein